MTTLNTQNTTKIKSNQISNQPKPKTNLDLVMDLITGEYQSGQTKITVKGRFSFTAFENPIKKIAEKIERERKTQVRKENLKLESLVANAELNSTVWNTDFIKQIETIESDIQKAESNMLTAIEATELLQLKEIEFNFDIESFKRELISSSPLNRRSNILALSEKELRKVFDSMLKRQVKFNLQGVERRDTETKETLAKQVKRFEIQMSNAKERITKLEIRIADSSNLDNVLALRAKLDTEKANLQNTQTKLNSANDKIKRLNF